METAFEVKSISSPPTKPFYSPAGEVSFRTTWNKDQDCDLCQTNVSTVATDGRSGVSDKKQFELGHVWQKLCRLKIASLENMLTITLLPDVQNSNRTEWKTQWRVNRNHAADSTGLFE